MLTFPLTPKPPTTTNAPVDVVVLVVPLDATKLAPLNTAGVVLVLTIGPVVVNVPLAASIVNGPTVSPLCTTKLLFAIVPYLPVGY
jgi:hypothetical protein